MAMTWAFLLVVLAALCFFAMTIAVLMMVFRAATRSSGHPQRDADGNLLPPPLIGDDQLTNPANPLYQLHHPTSPPEDPSRHQPFSPGSAPSTFEAPPSPSFDSGSSSPPSADAGGSGCG